jgi:hypothetical protein
MDDAPQLKLTPEEQHRVWAMRLAMTDVTWHMPAGREKTWNMRHARQALIDEINAAGGDWVIIAEEILGLLDTALTNMFSTEDRRSSSVIP